MCNERGEQKASHVCTAKCQEKMLQQSEIFQVNGVKTTKFRATRTVELLSQYQWQCCQILRSLKEARAASSEEKGQKFSTQKWLSEMVVSRFKQVSN